MQPLSHYQLVARVTKRGLVYHFTTDRGVVYALGFESDAEYLPGCSFADRAFSFAVTPVSGNWRGPNDPRIRQTVAFALQQAFEADPLLIISYTCSLNDDQERNRRILFGRWYQEHQELYERLTYDSEEDRLYSATLFRRDHPDARR